MPLPDLIEIVPLDKPVRAEITVPGSKSITNRALILAALANGETTLQGALWSEDTQVMVEALQKLGFEVKVEPDPDEFCNRTITVKGLGGKIPNSGTEQKPLEIFVGNAGTAARFLSAFVCLGNGVYRLDGVPRMRERPQAALFDALRELGYRIESPNRLPAVIYGRGPHAGKCKVSIQESSQFASALLLCANVGKWRVKVIGENSEESPYVKMTSQLVQAFPGANGELHIEPDASSGSYFWAAGCIAPGGLWSGWERPIAKVQRSSNWSEVEKQLEEEKSREIVVLSWPNHRPQLQIDAAFPCSIQLIHKAKSVSRRRHLGDSIMTFIVVTPLASHVSDGIKFTDLGRLRLQECERVVALRTELSKCGAKVIEQDDTLEVFPSKLHGAEIETYNDHRMAMCFAILGLKVPGIKIKNPSCVKKTFPNFFQKLATGPPHGLGVTILDGTSKRKLGLEELFAE